MGGTCDKGINLPHLLTWNYNSHGDLMYLNVPRIVHEICIIRVKNANKENMIMDSLEQKIRNKETYIIKHKGEKMLKISWRDSLLRIKRYLVS